MSNMAVDWTGGFITVRGDPSGEVKTDFEKQLDAGNFSRTQFLIEFGAMDGSPNFFIESGPDKQHLYNAVAGDSSIVVLTGPITPTVGQVLIWNFSDEDNTPVYRYLRWRTTSASAAFSVTFRITVLLKR